MSGESFINLEAVAFDCVDAIYSEPPKRRISHTITSVLRLCSDPTHVALLNLIHKLFNDAGFPKEKEAIAAPTQPDPVPTQSGPQMRALFEEASTLLRSGFTASPARRAFEAVDDLKRRRMQAAAEEDLQQLRRLEQALGQLLEEAPDPYRSAIFTNQIAVNASARYALGDTERLADAFESLCKMASIIPPSRVRSAVVANACFLASLLHQHNGDIAPLQRAQELITETDLSERNWTVMTNVVHCLLLLHEEEPDRFGSLLDDAVKLIPREVPEELPRAAAHVAQNLVNAYSTLARVTHDERYIELANQLSARLLKMPQVSVVAAGQLKTNHANRLLQRVEFGNLSQSEVRGSLIAAAELAREACRISADHSVPGEHRATDLECLARCLRELAQLQEPHQRIAMLEEALRHSREAMRATPVRASAWARHAEVRNLVLFDLAGLDRAQWVDPFLDACRETLQSGHASALTHWLHGHWLIDQGALGIESFESMVMGARLQESPVVRAERFMDILRHLQQLPIEDVEDWRSTILYDVLEGLLAVYRKLLWSPRGQEATRGAASALAWLGAVLAELTLLREGDAFKALRALGTVSNGIWAMNVSLVPTSSLEHGGSDLFFEDRLLLQAADDVVVPNYESEADSPSLVVLVAGPTRGWAIVRRTGQDDQVLELPDCSDGAARSAIDSFSLVLDSKQLRRGTAGAASPACQEWLQRAIGQPIIDAGLDLGEWVGWCPTGPLIALPIHGMNVPGLRAQSYVTNPLFDPRALHSHLSTDPVEWPRFLGWSTYPPGVNDLPGVAPEAVAFQRVAEGVAQIDADANALSVTSEEPLHLACHGVSTGPHGDALLVLGFRDVSMLEIVSMFRGARPFVLLNACLTAHPAPGLEEQHLTLVKAFQVAGVHSVVGSLWAVADGGGIPDLLIEGFYGELLKPPEPCFCERCVAHATMTAITLFQSRGLGWEDWLNWTHTIG